MRTQSHFLAVISLGMLLVAGCALQCPVQRLANSPPELENQPPVVVDQAMQLRNWERSTALYGNGNVIAGPTGFLYETRRGQPEWIYLIEESPLFLGQAVAAPIVLIFTPPWSPVLYTGVTIGPTFHALPPLPGGSPAGITAPEPEATTE